MMGWNGSWSWVGGLAMMAGMVIVWGLIIWGIVALVRSTVPRETATGTSGEHRAQPEQILAERFARGEIEAEEYAQRLELLRSPHGSTERHIETVSPSQGRELVHR